MPKAASVFRKREKPKRELRVKVDADLLEIHEEVKTELEQLAPDLEFDLNDCVEKSVRQAITAARKELGKFQKKAEPALNLS